MSAASVADRMCSCSWLTKTTKALAGFWFLSFPLGFAALYAAHIARSLQSRRSYFRTRVLEPWGTYLGKIRSARGDADDFCQPKYIHTVLRTALATVGVVCVFVAIRASSLVKGSVDSEHSQLIAQVALLFFFGLGMCVAAWRLGSKVGRRVVVWVTNRLGSLMGKRFEFSSDLDRQEVLCVAPASRPSRLVSLLATAYKKISVAADWQNVEPSSCRGSWLRVQNLGMFVVDFRDRWALFALVVMAKNILIGVLLTNDPVTLVDVKAKVPPPLRVVAPRK